HVSSVSKGNDYKTGDEYDIWKYLYSLEDYAPYEVIGMTNATGTFTDHDITAVILFKDPSITIDAPDKVCSQQDCKFTVTAPEGVTIVSADYGNDYMVSSVQLTSNEDGGLSGVVPASGFAQFGDSFKLTVYGTVADGTPVSSAKTVQVSPRHIYMDGVCGCGAVQEYTVQYDGGAEFGLCVDFKTHGRNLTLRGETFRRDGYVQTGWVDKESGAVYDLGDVYTTDADVTLNPVWDEILTLNVPFTTTVALDGDTVPGETVFELSVIGSGAGETDISDVTVSGSVITNGAGDYKGTLTFTGPREQIRNMLCEGALVQQMDAGEEGWTVDDTVWGLLLEEERIEYALRSTDTASVYRVIVVPAACDDAGNYFIDWNSIDWDNLQSEDMRFVNTYTAHDYELKYNETHHWDECSCGDVQNREPHKYGDWTVTKEATETEEGEKEHSCTVCGYTETETIAKLNGTDGPQTGVDSNTALWSALMAVSAASVTGISVYSKRRKSSHNK
ncbi:MAG: LPXTG cell wall anchor domain-containing protein, partial [Eubacteriales bacterium]